MDRKMTSYKSLAQEMVRIASDDKGLSYAICKFNDAWKLLKELLKYNAVMIDCIELALPDFDNYYDEYYISLEKDMHVIVEYAKRNDRYLMVDHDADKIFITGDCNSGILNGCSMSRCCEVYFDYKAFLEQAIKEYNLSDEDISKIVEQLSSKSEKDSAKKESGKETTESKKDAKELEKTKPKEKSIREIRSNFFNDFFDGIIGDIFDY